MKSAILLLSGGLDSTTCLAIAQSEGFDIYALSFRYGQRHQHEIEAAKRIAERAGVVRHIILDIDLRQFGGSALTADLPVPKHKTAADITGSGIPITYVPARNTIFLSFALAYAEVVPSDDIFLGVNALDYSGYPDCRPEYIHAYQQMASLATQRGVEGHPIRIHTPLIAMTKSQIINRGLELGVDYGITTSCYDPSVEGLACGRCDACLLRLKGFADASTRDPARYVG